MSYPIIGSAHAKILRFVAGAVRQPVVTVAGTHVFDLSEIGSLSDDHLQPLTTVVIQDDQEHVVTINTSQPHATFSSGSSDLAVECALNGWLEARQ